MDAYLINTFIKQIWQPKTFVLVLTQDFQTQVVFFDKKSFRINTEVHGMFHKAKNSCQFGNFLACEKSREDSETSFLDCWLNKKFLAHYVLFNPQGIMNNPLYENFILLINHCNPFQLKTILVNLWCLW